MISSNFQFHDNQIKYIFVSLSLKFNRLTFTRFFLICSLLLTVEDLTVYFSRSLVNTVIKNNLFGKCLVKIGAVFRKIHVCCKFGLIKVWTLLLPKICKTLYLFMFYIKHGKGTFLGYGLYTNPCRAQSFIFDSSFVHIF